MASLTIYEIYFSYLTSFSISLLSAKYIHHHVKKMGDRMSFCLIPLWFLNRGVGVPSTRTEN